MIMQAAVTGIPDFSKRRISLRMGTKNSSQPSIMGESGQR
jgi:hypothetical protein